MKSITIIAAALCAALPHAVLATLPAAQSIVLRAPAVPLVTVDPYFSLWSFGDELYGSPTVHWTGEKQPVTMAVRVDGRTHRVMGMEDVLLSEVLPSGVNGKWEARYMNAKPAEGWNTPGFDDRTWTKGFGPFGSADRDPATLWSKGDVWVRRTFDLKEDLRGGKVVAEFSHDDVFELYVNGIKVAETGNKWRDGVRVTLPEEVVATLGRGRVTIAAHCRNTRGGSYVDFGLFKVVPNSIKFPQAAVQRSVDVLPTQTFYTLDCGPVEVRLVFTAPLLQDDLTLMSTPVNYLTYAVRSTDGKQHDVQLYLEASPLLAVNRPGQPTVSQSGTTGRVDFLRCGTEEQNVLGRKGDNVRIDWGYFYLAAPDGGMAMTVADSRAARERFAASGATEGAGRGDGSLVGVRDLGRVGAQPVADFVMLAYDDLYSIRYFGEDLRPYWNRDGKTAFADLLDRAAKAGADVLARCADFDGRMMEEAERAGGRKYAELCALAYRQAVSAHKLVEDGEGNLLFFSKENFSNGSIGTVDISYPSSPLFLRYNPELLKGMLNPIFHYSESGRWKKPFAAHDVGTYPMANGQTYKGDMPVEENGNMLILCAAIARVEGGAGYAALHWDALTTWADYLVREGLDPANQLCTDDFAGHFAHNANLSIKAVTGIACYADLARMLGKRDVAGKYLATAREMAARWKTIAADGDHYRLVFDKPGTWSQKYNLVWDRMMGLGVFDPAIARTEVDYYLSRQGELGLPLDSRRTYTKSDWTVWTACLTGDAEDFRRLTESVWNYADKTPTRIPHSDWYETTDGRSVAFRARSVVGGYWIRMLEGRLGAQK